MNLLSNALKFTDKGTIILKCYQERGESEELTVSVIDSGIGIAKEQQHLLFKTYSQIENDLVNSKEGTGLGLALSKKLMELLGGRLFLEASELGMGSTFTLKMPIDSSKRLSAGIKNAPKDVIPKFNGVHVLIVDDAKENLFIVEQFLSETEAIITLEDNPIAAVEFARKHLDSIDVIFLDIMMPQMSGYEACAKIRTLGYHGPIIALSAHSEIEMVNEEKKFSFDGHLMKPINKESLWASIRKAVLS